MNDIIRFGYSMIKDLIAGLLVVVIIGASFGMLKEGILFCIALIPIRECAGGFHMKTKQGCALVSSIIYVIAILVIKNVYLSFTQLFLGYCVGAFLLFVLVPIDNQNNRLSERERQTMEKKSIRILFVENAIFFFLTWAIDYSYLLVFCISLFVCDLLLLMGVGENEIQNWNSRRRKISL